MGLLDKLWDDTLAGPRPESGLGRLRKHSSFSPRSDSSLKVTVGGSATSEEGVGGQAAGQSVKVTRSITIVRPAGYASPPVSPAGSSPSSLSPLSGGGRGTYRFQRKWSSDAGERASASENRPRSPPPTHDL